MVVLLIIIAVLVGLLNWQVAADAKLGRQLLIRASDLNLERQQQIIDRLEAVEDHLSDMSKVRKEWQD